jgi:cytochrome b561
MKTFYKKFLLVHLLVTFMLFVTWLAGESIKDESGPMSAVYYVLHIFPGSLIFMLITFEWLVRNQGKLIRTQGMPLHLWINRNLHRAYYLILLALPLTGILVFFDFVEARPFYMIHSTLFNLLMLLIGINLASMALGWLTDRNAH